MSTDQRPMHFRTSFDQTADDYDAIRPGYPRDLITDIVTLAALPTPASILEIGCGTGQATLPFAQRGDHLLCLDIGAALLAIAQRKFAAYPHVHFHQSAFETWPVQPSTFDLVMSATAFHWIEPEIGYAKAANLLKDTGSLAILSMNTAHRHQRSRRICTRLSSRLSLTGLIHGPSLILMPPLPQRLPPSTIPDSSCPSSSRPIRGRRPTPPRTISA